MKYVKYESIVFLQYRIQVAPAKIKIRGDNGRVQFENHKQWNSAL
jgi:hypothetical protein